MKKKKKKISIPELLKSYDERDMTIYTAVFKDSKYKLKTCTGIILTDDYEEHDLENIIHCGCYINELRYVDVSKPFEMISITTNRKSKIDPSRLISLAINIYDKNIDKEAK